MLTVCGDLSAHESRFFDADKKVVGEGYGGHSGLQEILDAGEMGQLPKTIPPDRLVGGRRGPSMWDPAEFLGSDDKESDSEALRALLHGQVL